MSTDTKARKRKSGDNVVPAAKKIKTTTEANVAKSADRPAPGKSALKKSKVETTITSKANGKKTKTKKKVIEEPAPDSEEADTIVSDAEQGGADLTADQTEALLAGFTDSEDEDEDENVDEGLDIAKLPVPPKAKKTTTTDKPSDPETTPGVIYIGRLPHGFYEKQLHAYLSQFGTITPHHLRLSRNKKTGKSKHFAFVEFESASVADIVAKTMDKYLLFGHILQVRRVPAEQVTEGMWKGPKGVKGGKVRPRNRIEGTRFRKGAERGVWEGRVTREQERRDAKAKKLAEMGYDFEMPDVKTVDAVPKQKKDVESVATLQVEDDAAKIEEPEEGVKLLEGKKKKQGGGVEKKVEKVVEVSGEVPVVTEETTVKRKNKATGSTFTTKKRKVKAAA
ncbi:hypothetical protein DOTSEDRAFT_129718 [Dothistroma septosporum NZE10]|uniref:RRM domain-containing protein n=1 Tax=Dothistroma septosporum (strain NZE10 / CBS 128990) TaxID=675120 RepID=N1PN17_DOTSN|nr:hypothetical protein DOTSEDRAFT_129718 [Dothistroma septosporum NZE10]